MKYVRAAAPAAVPRFDIDGRVHITSLFGDPWCDEAVSLDNYPDQGALVDDPARLDWCPMCLAEARDEGLITE